MRKGPPRLDDALRPWLLLGALVCSLPHYAHQPAWLSLLSALVLAWSTALWWRQRGLPARWLLALFVVGGSLGIWLEFRSLFGRDAGVATLVLFMGLKLLELKTRRDALVLITLGYFLLLTHYFYSQSILTAFWLLACLVLLSATLIRLHGGQAGSPWPTLRLSARLCLQALPFMLLLYLLFPRVNGPLWGLPADAHAGRTGLSDTLRPGSIAELVKNPEIAFRVKFAGPPPPRDKLYWRGPVMEAFDGQTWRPSRERRGAERIDYLSPAIPYESTLEPHTQRWLLALDAPRDLPPETGLDGRLTVTHRQIIDQRRRFALSASLDYRLNVDENPATLAANRRLPGRLNPRAHALARAWQVTAATPEAIVGKALALFAGERFAYTLQPPLLGEHAIDDFLFTTRRGFCEHYAAAFVVLMRAAGLPARIVGGYQGGEINPVDGYLVVRQSDAHAWAEVWLDGRGWVRVDPTAVVTPARISDGLGEALPGAEMPAALARLRTDWLRALRYRWEALNNAWNQSIIAYDSQRQRDLLGRLGLPDSDWRTLASLLATSSSVALFMLAVWALRRPATADPALRLWQQALRQVASSTVDCPPWATPLMIAEHVKTRCPALAEDFSAVTTAYLAARYGRGGLPALRTAVLRLRRQRLRRLF